MQIDFGDAKKESDESFDPEPRQDTNLAGGQAQMFQDMQDDIAGGASTRRGTFVGTVNFLAPEMIQSQEATLASDLWALGCIIFKMLTGKVPFPGMSEMQVFPLILARKIDWPKNQEIDPVCRDLIEKLIQLDPLDRLGCPMTKNDMTKLMSHPFFDGLSFSKPLAETTDV